MAPPDLRRTPDSIKTRLAPRLEADDVPAAQRAALERIAHTKASRRGQTVLLAGAAGAPATRAAETLAAMLGIEAFRIDLAAVMSKYLGETEKNIEMVLRSAEINEAVLLFDEADALFGQRGEVKDAHDRYANLDMATLLTKIDSFEGVALLATNLGTNIDPTFSRRLRRIIDYTPR